MSKNMFFSINSTDTLPSCAIFISGTGSNACKLIEHVLNDESPSYKIKVLFTDRPKSSQTKTISEKYNIPMLSIGLKQFYSDRGLTSTSLMTEKGKEVRELWTQEVIKSLEPYDIDFGLLAGFEPLCNIMNHFPCLNIHPGDLTYLKGGERHLVGLHAIPVERAICEALETLRSSVILAEPFVGKGENMDSGYILGISDEVKIDLMGHSLEELEASYFARVESLRGSSRADDLLRTVAKYNQEKLKENGDWILFPKVVKDFALNRFSYSDDKKLYYAAPAPVPVSTIVYGSDFKELVFSIS